MYGYLLWFAKTCTDLLIWGKYLSSHVGCGKFSRQVTEMIVLPLFQYSVIVGLLLSDAGLSFASVSNKNARLSFQ
jgi:hypothetical protein